MSGIKRVVVLLTLLLVWQLVSAQSSSWAWAKRGGGSAAEVSQSMVTDASGNSYIAGYYKGNAVFGSITLAGSADYYNAYVAKLDPNGNWLWATRTTGTFDEFANDLAIDPSGTYLYVTGSFNSQPAFFGSYSIYSTDADTDIFVAKINASSGAWMWAKKAGGDSADTGYAITLDANSNLYVTGDFGNTATFIAGAINLTSTGGKDVFLAKINSSGTWQWAIRAGGASDDQAKDIALSAAGDLYVTGGFYSSEAVFGDYTLDNSGSWDIFVAKASTAGVWQWAQEAGGTGLDVGYGISADPANNLYITGLKALAVHFGSISLPGTDAYDTFVAKISSSGTWLWARKPNCTSMDLAYAIDVDAWYNVHVTGVFRGSAVFGSTSLSGATTNNDAFLATLDSGGNWLSAEKTGSTQNNEAGTAVCSNAAAGIHWYGYFAGDVTIGSTSLSSNAGSQDVFIAKKTSSPIALLTPNGGEEWYVGSPHAITWTSANIQDVHLDYSTNNGSTWTEITGAAIPASPGSYGWTVPNAVSAQVRVRVRSAADSSVMDASDAVFTIQAEAVPPEANFSASPLTGNEPLNVQFTDNSLPVSGSLVAWLWNFGDGDSATQQNPLHTFQNDGTYTVSLTVTNSAGLTDTETKTAYISVAPTFPRMDLQSPNSLDFGSVDIGVQSAIQNVVLRNSGTANLTLSALHFNGAPLHFHFTQPASLTIAPGATLSIPVWFAPQSAGPLTDILHIENNSQNLPLLQIALGGTGVEVIYPPTANFSASPTIGVAPLAVQFSDQSTPGSGQITTWAWNFGDGGSSYLQHPLHEYLAAGVYSVTLTVTNSHSLNAQLIRTNYITVSAPTIILALQSPSALDFGQVEVDTQSPVQNVLLANNGNTPLEVSSVYFTESVQHFSFSEPTRSFSIAPNQSATIQVRFTPHSEGLLRDTLNIVNNSQNQTLLRIALSGTGYVVYDPPLADFSASPTSGLIPLPVQFSDSSQPGSGEIVSWAWNFGNGGVSDQQNPNYTYTSAGNFTVSLTVTNSHGLSATKARVAYISAAIPVGNILLLSPGPLNFGDVYIGQTSPPIPVRLRNNGNRNILISSVLFHNDPTFFTCQYAEESLILEPGETDSIFVRFTPAAAGAIVDSLRITDDSDNLPLMRIRLQARGIYPPPRNVQNLQIFKANDDISLTWDPVTEDILGDPISVEYYLVYTNGLSTLEQGFVYHGLTSGTSYNQLAVTLFAPRMFYKVVPWDAYPGFTRSADLDGYLRDNLIPGMSENEVERILLDARKSLP